MAFRRRTYLALMAMNTFSLVIHAHEGAWTWLAVDLFLLAMWTFCALRAEP